MVPDARAGVMFRNSAIASAGQFVPSGERKMLMVTVPAGVPVHERIKIPNAPMYPVLVLVFEEPSPVDPLVIVFVPL